MIISVLVVTVPVAVALLVLVPFVRRHKTPITSRREVTALADEARRVLAPNGIELNGEGSPGSGGRRATASRYMHARRTMLSESHARIEPAARR